MHNTFKKKTIYFNIYKYAITSIYEIPLKLIAIVIYCRLIQLQISSEIFAIDRNINLLLAIVLWIMELFHKLWPLRAILFFFLVHYTAVRTSWNCFHSLCPLKLRYLAGLSQFKYLVVIYLLVDLLIYLPIQHLLIVNFL